MNGAGVPSRTPALVKLEAAEREEWHRSGWPDLIHRALGELSVRQVAFVPDAGHTRLIELCQSDSSMRAVPLTTEEEGVALAAGAWLGGQRAVLLMQSSGVGNCVNMLALNQVCRFPLLALITMRGEWGELRIRGSCPWARAPPTCSSSRA